MTVKIYFFSTFAHLSKAQLLCRNGIYRLHGSASTSQMGTCCHCPDMETTSMQFKIWTRPYQWPCTKNYTNVK
ncbi:hypothetical protein BJV82DRAFT_632676 [Fennellomyces sp. T-0311]|nr:hypothetical protein BJV82DRAFT_632676 [Fennellomyces sp. T-0311]